MAGKGPTVTLTFAGDAKNLQGTVKQVEASTSTLGDKVRGLGVGMAAFGAASAGGALLAAGALAAVPLAFAGIGIAAAMQSEKVKTAFSGLGDHVKSEMTKLAAPIEPVLLGIATKAKAAFTEISPALAGIFRDVAPMVDLLATSVMSLVTGAMPGFQLAISAAKPVIDALGAGIAGMGPAITGFFAGISGGAPGAATAMTMLFDAVNWLLPAAGQLIGWLAQWSGVIVPIVAGMGALAVGVKLVTAGIAAYNAIATVVRTVTLAWTAVQTALNFVLAANPIGIVVIAVAAFVAAIVIAYQKSETFRSIVQSAWAGIKSTISSSVNAIKGILNWFGTLPGLFRGWFNGAVSAVTAAFNNIAARARNLPGLLVAAFAILPNMLINSGRGMIEGLWRGISGAIGWIKGKIGGALSSIRNLFPFSPAKEGPFSGSGYTTFSGAALANDFAAGISSGVPAIQAAGAAAIAAAGDMVRAEDGSYVPASFYAKPMGSSSDMVRAEDGSYVPRSFYATPAKRSGMVRAEDGSYVPASFYDKPVTLKITGNTDGAMASAINHLARTGQIQGVR